MSNANEELQEEFYQALDDALLNGKFKQQPVGMLNEPRHKSSAWIQDTIDKLISFKQLVDDGHVIIMDGDYNVSHPAPDREQVTYDYISLSIDFVETKSQN